MKDLLPHYPKMSAQFDEDRREGRSFDTLELFVRHFLREGSVFVAFGLERLYKREILTDLHLRDIFRQNRSISEDLDLLDDAVDEVDERNIKGLSNSLRSVNEPFQSQLLTAIRRREAQERRTMARRFLAKVANSRQKLFEAYIMQDLSSEFIEFVNQIGSCVDVWKSGTRAIRDIREGSIFNTCSLSDIVSALRVADAMRSVVPSSRLGCSNEE